VKVARGIENNFDRYLMIPDLTTQEVFLPTASAFRGRIDPSGRPCGLAEARPIDAELCKPLGYIIGEFGKSDLGDPNEVAPMAQGFDGL
jgi:hypothetical protein